MLPSSFTSVSLLNFWQVFRSGKALPSINRITKIMPALDHCLMRVSSLILVMLLLNLWLYTTQNIFAYRSDLRTLQDIELTHCQGKNSSFSQTEGGDHCRFIWLPGMKPWSSQASQQLRRRQLNRLNLTEPINQCNLSIGYMGTGTLEWRISQLNWIK